MIRKSGLAAAGLGAVFCVATVAAPAAAETPKRGGILTYMIPADAPPSFDGHRETTFATVHAAAPFYSVLIRVNPNNPSSTTDFVCDLCTEMPTPTDDGKTYTFKIRQGVKFHDGAPLTAYDVAASWRKIISPPEGVSSAREWYRCAQKSPRRPSARLNARASRTDNPVMPRARDGLSRASTIRWTWSAWTEK